VLKKSIVICLHQALEHCIDIDHFNFLCSQFLHYSFIADTEDQKWMVPMVTTCLNLHQLLPRLKLT